MDERVIHLHIRVHEYIEDRMRYTVVYRSF